MMTDEIRAAEKRIDRAKDALTDAQNEIKVAEFELWVLVGDHEGIPIEDGWYLDENDNPWRRTEGIWDDGWGNAGPDYGYPTPPLRRLEIVPPSIQK